MKWLKKQDLKPDIIVIGVVTFLLQTISFVTTLQGAKVYIGDVFPGASLFFAIAIQFCIWYFANTLSDKRRGLKIVALIAAVGCSTWFSFTGIYNLINSPTQYLEERYQTIRDELLTEGDNAIDYEKELLIKDLTDASYLVGTRKTKLQEEKERLLLCRSELDEKITVNAANKLKAPRQNQYETYEEYASAYQIYINALSQSSGIEVNASREQLLSSYGFDSMEAFDKAVNENAAALSEINLLTDTEQSGMELAQACITALEKGEMPSDEIIYRINSLFAAAKQENGTIYGNSFLLRLKACVNYRAQADMSTISVLKEKYSIQNISLESAMIYKASMETEIAAEKRRLSAFVYVVQTDLLSSGKEYEQTDTQITEVYLLPLKALLKGGVTNPAYYCFLIAALIDGMTLILAFSNIERKPVWDRKWQQQPDYAELWDQIAGCCSENQSNREYINEFLSHFKVSEYTLFRGYLMHASLEELSGYDTITAILCDSGHGFLKNHELFLKADIVYWMNAGENDVSNIKREVSVS